MKKFLFFTLIVLGLIQLSCKYDLPFPEKPKEIIEPVEPTDPEEPAEPIDSLPGNPIDSLPGNPIDSLPELPPVEKPPVSDKYNVIFDTDANNELDDQHALAYLFFNGNTFNVEGVTVNSTWNGGGIQGQYDEADRVIRLCDVSGRFPLLKGANGKFDDIKNNLNSGQYDGHEAVDFIIEKARASSDKKLILLAVGKLTNAALALKKDPSISKNIKIVWLGSNYPKSGEYNMENDVPSMNYVLDTDVEFEMVTVRNYSSSGTDAVRVSKEEINQRMPNKGPFVSDAVTGRHGVSFNRFGDYSVNLFDHVNLYGTPPSRAMFDMAAVAIVKDPTWATATKIPSPTYVDKTWKERPDNNRKITVWEYFNRDAIMEDFFNSMDHHTLVNE